MDNRSSFGVPRSPSPLGHGGNIPSGAELPVNRLHASFSVEGSNTIKRLTALEKGVTLTLDCTGSPTFANSSQLICPDGRDIHFAAGDGALVRSQGDGIWRVLKVFPARGEVLKSISEFGPVGSSDDTATWNRAVSYANSIGGHVAIHIPAGVRTTVGAVNPFLADHCYIVGDMAGSSTIVPTSGVSFTWGSTSQGVTVGGGISGVSLEFPSAAPGGSILFDLPNVAYFKIHDCMVQYAAQIARCGNASGSTSNVDVRGLKGFVSNSGVPAFDLIKGSGFYSRDNQLYVPISTPVHPSPSSVVAGTHFVNATTGNWDTVVIADTLAERFDSPFFVSAPTAVVINNFWIDTGTFDLCARGVVLGAQAGGSCIGMHMTDSWVTPWDGKGVWVVGAGDNKGHVFTGNRLSLCGLDGFHINSTTAKDITVTGNIIYACNRAGSGSNGITVDGGVSGFNISGNRVGDDFTAEGLPYNPVYGLSIGADCDEYVVSANWAKGSSGGYNLPDNTTNSYSRTVRNNAGPGGPDYAGWKGVGIYGATITSGTAWVNKNAFAVDVYVAGGTVSDISITCTGSAFLSTTGLASGAFSLEPGEAIKITFSVAPAVRFKVCI